MAIDTNADFTPSIPDSGVVPTKLPYNPTGSFKFWAQKVLPLVYDDSLSYYEVLCKVVDYLNNVIQNVDNLNDSVDSTNQSFATLEEYVNTTKDTLIATYNELQDYVNTYFDNLDVQQEINNKLDDMAESGELTTLLAPFIPDLVTAWLTSHVTPVGSAVVVDNTLSIRGAAADAEKTGHEIKSVREGLNGVVTNLNEFVMHNGKVLTVFSPKAWDFTTNTIVDSDSVVKSEPIETSSGKIIFVDFPSGVQARFTFLNGNTILSASNWINAPIALTNTLDGVNLFTVEFKYSDNATINSISDIIGDTSIYMPTLDEYSDGFTYGAYDFINSVWVVTNTVLHASYDYTNGSFIFIENKDPSTFRYRLSFFNENTSVGTTSWITNNFEGSNVLGATKISVEIGYLDNRIIKDRDIVRNNFVIKPTPSDSIINDITTVGIFEKWATIGDSFSVGRWYERDGDTYIPVRTSHLAWGSIIAREVGNTFLSLGIGGINTRTWLTAPPSSGGGLELALESPAQELYFLCLGINDTSLGASYIGSESDIDDADYTNNEDTFYGNYGRIIQQMKEHSPNALFIISKLVAWNVSSVKDAYNNAIQGIANHFGIPCIDPFEDAFFYSSFYQENRGGNNGHPVGMLYGGMAMAYKRLINKCIYENPTYFVGYNGTADGGV